MTRSQTIVVPVQCPRCGGGVCFEWDAAAPSESAVHCRTVHAGASCDWRRPVTVDADAERFVVVSDPDA